MTQTLRKTAAGLIVAGVWGWGPTPAAAQDTAIHTMRVLLLNPAGAPPTVLAGAEAAAARVFRQAGIETTWRHASDGRGNPDMGPAEDLASVIIVNLMSAPMEARVRESATAVGFAVAGGRFANIMYERVERLAQGTSTDLATVLGHVMAHEIGHLLLPPNAHSSGGIMNPTLSPLLAAQGVLWFTSMEAAGLRTRIAALARTHDTPAPTTSQNLLAADPHAIARFLAARPAPVSAEERARVLSVLPLEGEVTNFSGSTRRKLAALNDVLRATGRESVYEIRVIDVPQAAVAVYARAVILVSEAALTLLDADELQASLAHEIGHDYVWTEREQALQLADHIRLKDLELVCDAIAIVTLHNLGMDVSRLISGVQKTSRFNRERLGTANNERDYPTLAQRQKFAAAMAARFAESVVGVEVR